MAPRVFTTVTAPAGDQELTTVPAVKLGLGITTSDHDEYLDAAIRAASAEIAKYCNRVFKAETIVDTIFIDRPVQNLILSRQPIITITTVVEATETLTADDYIADTAAGMLLRLDGSGNPACWPAAKAVITYQAGFATVPSDLDRAAQRVVAHAFMARERDPSIRSVKIPDLYEAQYWVEAEGRASMPTDVMGIIDSYVVHAL